MMVAGVSWCYLNTMRPYAPRMLSHPTVQPTMGLYLGGHSCADAVYLQCSKIRGHSAIVALHAKHSQAAARRESADYFGDAGTWHPSLADVTAVRA